MVEIGFEGLLNQQWLQGLSLKVVVESENHYCKGSELKK